MKKDKNLCRGVRAAPCSRRAASISAEVFGGAFSLNGIDLCWTSRLFYVPARHAFVDGRGPWPFNDERPNIKAGSSSGCSP
jgi:hypothetical protein